LAQVALVKADTAAILIDTAEIGTAGAGLTALATQTSVNTIDDFIDTEIAAIKAKTDLLTFVGSNISADAVAINGDTNTPLYMQIMLAGNTFGTASGVPTTTSIPTSSLTPAASVDDQFKGLILKFRSDTTTAALRNQGTDITASTAAGVLTVTALTTAPVSGDTFTIS
jgi:hypothetical protein